MSNFIEELEKMNKRDTKVRAVLRRSLSFDPGCFPAAYPYVEPFVVKEENKSWRRKMFYLVAGLWASHWREGRAGAPVSIGKACALFDSNKRKNMNREDRKKMSSTERRFIALLDADSDQLSHRLRQMVKLLNDQLIDFDALLKRLQYWNNDQKYTQNQWARDFYRNADNNDNTANNTNEEDKE